MAAVVAARWDVEWDRGAGWRTRVGRRTRSGDTLLLAEPAFWEVRPVDAPTTTAAVLIAPGVAAADGSYIDVTISAAQIEALGADTMEYRFLAHDTVNDLPLVLLRGYVKVRDTVGDD
jgi:hypothetical protein